MAPMARRTLTKLLLAPAAVAALVGVSVAPTEASAGAQYIWQSSDQWGQFTTSDNYTLYNDIWGSGAGSQTIWANSSSNWGVTANHPNTGGVKAYPNIKKVINKRLSSLSSLKSSYNVSVPSSGAYNTSYDIWDTNYQYEIMLWPNWTGAVGPIGGQQTSVTVGGASWNVYRGSNGSNQVFSFLRTSRSTSGTVDVLAILNWLKSQGWWGDVTVGDVQFGYEITSSQGGLNFTTNSYNVTSS
jgi:glycosyl hydrolase family 12